MCWHIRAANRVGHLFWPCNNRSKKSAITSTAKKDLKYSKNKPPTTTEDNPDKEATTVTFQEPNIKKQKRKQRKFLQDSDGSVK